MYNFRSSFLVVMYNVLAPCPYWL